VSQRLLLLATWQARRFTGSEEETMVEVATTGSHLGARITGVDLAQPLSEVDFQAIRQAFATYGVLCFPGQTLGPAEHKAFARRFGSLEINVAAGPYSLPGYPELMHLSNIIRDGKAVGLNDAGQAWHTDMSYSEPIAFLNVLYAIEVPYRDGRPLGDTLFANMRLAYEELPEDVKRRIDGRTATHDFAKLWDEMRQRPGSVRPPLTEAQKAQKPPVSHPLVLTHPVNGRKSLYCNPGYAVRIDGMAAAESDELLDYLFRHQVEERFVYAHHWTRGDVLAWDNLWLIHDAVGDYGPDEHRLMRRCQVMADEVFAN
jgi:taurine dioxygenase